MFLTILDGLAGEEVDVVVTVGAQNDPSVLGTQPANVRVRRFVPQAELLPHCSAVVTHGGSGSMLGALAHGLPLLVVPQGADQFTNADLIAAAGAGIELRADELSASAVRDGVRSLLGSTPYRDAARAIAAEIAALPPPSDAVRALERLVDSASSRRRGRTGRSGGAPFPRDRGSPASQACCIACMFFIITADTTCSSSAGLNWRYSVPASAVGTWPGGR